MGVSRVLVGDDGSTTAAGARAWATEFARGAAAELVVARAVDKSSGVSDGAVQELVGHAATALLAYAGEISADLVVVGRRGAGGFDALRLGSTAHQVVEHATMPVAVVPDVPEDVGSWPITTVVVGIDGSPAAASALAWTVPVAASSGAFVVVVHALEIAPAFAAAGLDEAYEQARAKAVETVERWCTPVRLAGVRYAPIVEEGGPATILLDVTRRRGAGLLVIGRRTPGAFPGMPMGSVAHRAVGLAPCPTIVVPASG
jgi:nucleotide-binding universal stress UspA family protein